MTGPARVQLSRSAGWRLPVGAVVVGRPGPYGNWYRVVAPLPRAGRRLYGIERAVKGTSPVVLNRTHVTPRAAAADCVALFRGDLEQALSPATGQFARPEARALAARLHEIRGRPLACWCPPDMPCHADALLALANAEAVA